MAAYRSIVFPKLKISKLINVILAALALHAAGVCAQVGYPAKPIQFVVPYPPGGSNDLFARGCVVEAAWPGSVVDDHRLAERLRKALSDRSGKEIVRPAGRIGNDKLDRFGGVPGLCTHPRDMERQCRQEQPGYIWNF